MLEEWAVYSLGQRGPGQLAHQAMETRSHEFQGFVQGHTASSRVAPGSQRRQPINHPAAEQARRAFEEGVPGSILWQAQTCLYGSERPCLLSMKTSFPLERGAKVIFTQGGLAGGWSRNLGQAPWQERAYLLPATGAGGGGRGGAAHTTCGRPGGRHPPGRSEAVGSPEDGESENPNLERGVTWGPRAEPRAGRRERARAGARWPRKRRAPPTQPGRESYRQSQAGPGAAGPRPPP